MIKICQELEWLRPYALLGMMLVPRKHKLARIGKWTLGKSRGKDEFAALIQRKKGGPHRIWLHTHYYSGEEEKRFSKIDILNHLAHEIAHMEDWKHTPRHKRLEAKIVRAFMKRLEADGYISEEMELA
jgi:hypothetical protein